MAVFTVFVEGATDGSPAGLSRLAEAIASHYGLPAPDLLARLQKGRFRVKGNIDRATAELYVRDLERLGARCAIEEANAQSAQRATPLPFPAVRPATPPAGVAQYQSGLAAAFSADTPSAGLGALEKEGAAFALASVDGADDQPAATGAAFEPPADTMSASIGPPPEKPKAAAKPEKPRDVPLDLFAPPDADDAKLSVDIAADELDVSAKRRQSSPAVESEPAARQSQPAMRASQPSLHTPPGGVATVAPANRLGPFGEPRVRFAAGVLLAVLLGFVPAHLVASMREGSAYKTIDDKVLASQQLADTPDAYATLDKMRSDQLERKKSEQRNAAIIAFAVWALVGTGIAFVWFKKIPWDRLE